MAEVKVNQSSTAIQTTSQGERQSAGLTRWGAGFPSLFSLSPRDFFNASPFELMRRFTEEMDRVFEGWGFSRRSWPGAETMAWSPDVEVFERDNNLVVRVDLPGLSKDDIKVEMTDQGLVIQGERKREHEEKGEGWYRSERSYGQFYRLIPVPEGVNADQAQAHFENGVLEISAPIPESQRRRRSIPISTGGQQAQTASAQSK
jgi:HSP20 family protein